MTFYSKVLEKLVAEGQISKLDRVLVVCGGSYDAETLRNVGMVSVVIGNLDESMDRSIAPYQWTKLDAEALVFDDNAFDWVFVHAGLHHCYSPHRALLEMLRVGSKGVLVFEARDSLLIRVAVSLGLVPDYEIYSVLLTLHRRSGGLVNGPLPNYIYRWTEREVMKTVESRYPHRQNGYRFFYSLRLPTQRLAMSGLLKRMVASFLGAGASLIQKVAPRQCNEFAFFIKHSSQFKPWMDERGEYVRAEYSGNMDLSKYRKN